MAAQAIKVGLNETRALNKTAVKINDSDGMMGQSFNRIGPMRMHDRASHLSQERTN